MKRWQRAALTVAISVVVLIVLAITVAKVVFTKDRILAALTPRIEERINRPVHIGEAGISFYGGIGVWLGDITVGNRPGFSDEPLLTLHRFDLKARFWPLLLGRVQIDHVNLAAPSILLEYDMSGQSNLDSLIAVDESDDSLMTLPSREATPGPPVAVDRIVVLDGSFISRDAATGRRNYLAGIDLDFRWQGEDDGAGRHFETVLSVDTLEVTGQEDRWSIGEGEPEIHARGQWNAGTETVHLDSVAVSWWGAVATAQGVVRRHAALTEVQFQSRVRSTPLRDLSARIGSARGIDLFQNLDGVVSGELTATLLWPLPDGMVPEWRLDLDLEDLHWQLPAYDDELSLPRLEIRGEDQTLSWVGPAGRFGAGEVSLSGTVDRLFTDEPMLSARVRAGIPLAAVRELLAPDVSWSVSGAVDCDLTAFGKLAEWQLARIAGSLNSDRVVLRDTLWQFDSLTAGFSIRSDGEHLDILAVDWTAGESAGNTVGGIDGLVALARSGFASEQVIRAQLTSRCTYLDLDQLTSDAAPAVFSDSQGTGSPIPLPILASGMLAADKLVYSGLEFADVEAEYEFRNGVLRMEPIAGQVLGGVFTSSLTWNLNEWPRPSFTTRVRADSVEADGILTRYFEWNGGLFGHVELDGHFSGRGRVAAEILPTLTATGRADMRTGRIGSAPLLAAIGEMAGISGLGQSRELRNVTVPFSISEGRINTDQLRFQSGGFRFGADGSFGLDRTLAYRVKVTSTGGDRSGSLPSGTELAFDLTGTVADPKVRLDAGSTARSLIDNLLPERADSAMGDAVKNAIKSILQPSKP
jgi:hypothetical protein